MPAMKLIVEFPVCDELCVYNSVDATPEASVIDVTPRVFDEMSEGKPFRIEPGEYVELYPAYPEWHDLAEETDRLRAEVAKLNTYISGLHAGGVDNWEGYSESLTAFHDEYPEGL